MEDIATLFYLSETFYCFALEAVYAQVDHRGWFGASLDAHDELEQAGLMVISSNDDECTEVLVDL